jgi:hypothetical protein
MLKIDSPRETRAQDDRQGFRRRAFAKGKEPFTVIIQEALTIAP